MATPGNYIGPWFSSLWVPLVVSGAGLALLGVLYLLLRLFVPRVAAIALAGTKEAWHQPLIWVEFVGGGFLLMVLALMPYNTFGDDVKVLKGSGLTVLIVLSIILAVWHASVSIADELEGRTALTLLSKPVSRRQFIIGKFLGVVFPAAMLCTVLGGVYLSSVSFKVGFEAMPLNVTPELPAQCRAEMWRIVPGLMLAFLAVIVMSSISVAISTRLPMVPNLLICATIYAAGNLLPLVVQSSAGQIPMVAFMGKLLATVLPVLDHFNIQAAVIAGRPIPLEYVAWAGGYALLYSGVAMLFALLLFEDRDLA